VTTKVLLGDEIGSRIHDIFAGEHFLLTSRFSPRLYILSPWISNVEIKGKIPKMGPMAPQICYDFETMDLAHAILLAKLLFEIKVILVTKPPNEETYSNPVYVESLLDFLDEIGCSVFVNDVLHSKMLLTQQIAIVGSMNLTKSALYNREEIGVSIDDLENLSILEAYANDIMKESKPYGYTATRDWKRERVTRGMLCEVLAESGEILYLRREEYRDLEIESILSNIERFYLRSIIKLMMEGKKPPLRSYNGPYKSQDEAMTFLKGVLARKQFPKIDFKYSSVNFDFEEFLKQWELKYDKKKTRQSGK